MLFIEMVGGCINETLQWIEISWIFWPSRSFSVGFGCNSKASKRIIVRKTTLKT